MDTNETASPRKCSMKKIFYGFGHVYNDLCAAMWFSYTLFYFQIVLQMESRTAGILIMIGQIVDSLATPVAGYLVDRTGARQAWHLAGTLAVAVGFSLIFSIKPSSFDIWVSVYYGMVITLFQTGWALVQISHLSILTDISSNHAHTSDLTAVRYTASVCCNIAVYVITLVILKNENKPNDIGPDDFYKFKEIALLITFVGLLCCLFFYCGMLSKKEVEYEEITGNDSKGANGLTVENPRKHFLTSSIIYQVSLMYMASRLYTTLNLIYIPLYLDERENNMQDPSDNFRRIIASVPLICFISSFLTSIFLKYRTSSCNDKLTYFAGTVISMSGSIWISFEASTNSDVQIYLIACLIGMGGSATMVSSLCLTADFVKLNGYGGGSVYSMVTFTDKLVSGIVVVIVQHLQTLSSSHFYQHVLSFICAGVTLVGFSSLLTLHHQTTRNSRTI